MIAAYHGNSEVVTLLVDRGANINAQNEVRVSDYIHTLLQHIREFMYVCSTFYV